MTNEEILSHVDHTLLAATATWEDIRKLCDEAVRFHTASVCVPSSFVARIRGAYPALRICTVVGFPLGNASTAAKLAETERALADGADEIDMVLHIGALKDGDTDYVTEEIAALKRACGSHVLKVIVETCCLTEAEKLRACDCVAAGGADYIKTSTGFGTAGAQLTDVQLFRAHLPPRVKIKAAGGIHTKEEMEAFLSAGADRLGASGAVKALAQG